MSAPSTAIQTYCRVLPWTSYNSAKMAQIRPITIIEIDRSNDLQTLSSLTLLFFMGSLFLCPAVTHQTWALSILQTTAAPQPQAHGPHCPSPSRKPRSHQWWASRVEGIGCYWTASIWRPKENAREGRGFYLWCLFVELSETVEDGWRQHRWAVSYRMDMVQLVSETKRTSRDLNWYLPAIHRHILTRIFSAPVNLENCFEQSSNNPQSCCRAPTVPMTPDLPSTLASSQKSLKSQAAKETARLQKVAHRASSIDFQR